MEYPAIKLVFDRRKKATATQAEVLYIELYHNRKRKYLSTNIYLRLGEWDSERRIVNRSDSMSQNIQLENQIKAIRKALTEMDEHGEDFTFEKLDLYLVSTNKDASFLDFMYNSIATRNMEESTRRQHLVVYNKLDSFGKIQSFRDLSPVALKAFDDYIRAEGLTLQTSIYGVHKRLKPYVREAYERGFIRENPYDKFRVANGKSADREFLSKEEIKKLTVKKLSPQLGIIRDLFLFGCYTGMAYSDILSFNYDNDVVESDGKLFISKHRQKTDEGFYVMLLAPALEILSRYDNALPAPSLQRYNTHLKLLAAECNIRKPLTSHIARHTFATTITLANKVPIEVVSKMLGHASIKTTQVYAKVLNKSIEDCMSILDKKLK